jgi:hypothetical protein
LKKQGQEVAACDFGGDNKVIIEQQLNSTSAHYAPPGKAEYD